MSLIAIGPAFGDSGTFEPPTKAEYTRAYVGHSNNPYDNPLSIVRDPLCPKPGTRDPFDLRAWITSVQAERRDQTALVWDITVNASTEYDPDAEVHPLLQPARITPASDQYLTTTRKNARGEWIRNAAGTVIPLEKEESRWVFNIEKNVRVLPAFLMELNNKINSGVVFLKGLLVPRHTLMVKGLRGEEQETRFQGAKLQYVTLFFQLHYNRQGYKVRFPNVDLVELVPVRYVPERDTQGRIRRVNHQVQYQRLQRVRTPILDADGEPVTEPWPLDRQGRALPRDYTASQLVELEEDVYEEVSFDVLPLR